MSLSSLSMHSFSSTFFFFLSISFIYFSVLFLFFSLPFLSSLSLPLLPNSIIQSSCRHPKATIKALAQSCKKKRLFPCLSLSFFSFSSIFFLPLFHSFTEAPVPACAVVAVMVVMECSRFHYVLHLENTSDDIAFLEVGLWKGGGTLLSVAQSSWKIQGF